MSSTDFLRLGEHKIFKEIRESLSKSKAKTLNLFALRDSVLFSWDFQNNCVLSLNVKAARSKEGEHISHQNLLPLRPPLFTPEFLVCNDSATILAVAGPSGVLVLQLPQRYPPHGAFDNNKEVVYCRSHSLDERLLSCSETLEVRQVRFHPGSSTDSHILVLTSENSLRLYGIINDEARRLAVYNVGEKPCGLFPGSKTTFLDLYGEIAVDFDFGQPEIDNAPEKANLDSVTTYIKTEDKMLVSVHTQTPTKIVPKNLFNLKNVQPKKDKEKSLAWPVYILRGDGSIYKMYIDLNLKNNHSLIGPLPMCNQSDNFDQSEASSIICLNTWPQIMCIATSTGTVIHFAALEAEDDDTHEVNMGSKPVKKMELIAFESVTLELGIMGNDSANETLSYKCPIYLHKDESNISRYFATHNAGVHLIDLSCVDELQQYIYGPKDSSPTSDIFANACSIEYLVCTKMANKENFNPIIGFTLYYEPTSIITLLKDGTLITLGLLSTSISSKFEDMALNDDDDASEENSSPLKKMLKEPFDQFIQKILKKAPTHPILKIPSGTDENAQQCYEILQRASQTFREKSKYHTRAREELEKRMYTLKMLKESQKKENERLIDEKQVLRRTAENLAETYENFNYKQEELLKRCEQLLMMVARKRPEPSDAELKFMEKLRYFSQNYNPSVKTAIEKLEKKSKYQEVQMANWRAQELKKVHSINEIQTNTIKQNLQESTQKITQMKNDVNEYKKQLNLD